MNMGRSNEFPHDRKIEVLRPDMTKYKTIESAHLMNVQNMNASEVRVTQAFRTKARDDDFLVKNPFYNGRSASHNNWEGQQ